ncbi:MAG TPA: dihydropteroate synthase [Solirubrobacteraceae bacterium]|jgi:dihydropteroate synthase|nr:dihydropteroate synthase [Solirubrobacteraceae bacterium]
MTIIFRLMGVVNVTPDSFSDGGLFLDAEAAITHARELVAEGAEIVDVGGESTRPGAEPVSADEETRRVLPVVEGIVAGNRTLTRPRVSIDTSKASVARACIDAGATLVNDVTALRGDPEMAGLVAESGAECCLMHMRGEPRTMQADPRYDDVVDDVRAFLEERMAYAVGEGVHEERIMLDPGFGFGKTLTHNLTLLARLDELSALGRPLVVGTSRKSFIGRILADAAGQTEPVAASRRLPGTIATNVLAYERGASVFRVHDVAPVRAALTVAAATLSERWDQGARRTPTS